MPEKRRHILAETDRGSYYNQEEWWWLRCIYDASESDDSENDDENYTENIGAVVCRSSSK